MAAGSEEAELEGALTEQLAEQRESLAAVAEALQADAESEELQEVRRAWLGIKEQHSRRSCRPGRACRRSQWLKHCGVGTSQLPDVCDGSKRLFIYLRRTIDGANASHNGCTSANGRRK